MEADGYTVYAPPDPLQGLTLRSAYLAHFLHSIAGPIVLVGHSYGGAVITNAATGDKQVKALVYVDAFAPAQGQTIAQLLASQPGSRAFPANLSVVPFPGAPSGVGEAYIKQSVFAGCMAHSACPPLKAHVLGVTQLPHRRRWRWGSRVASRRGRQSRRGRWWGPPTTPFRRRCS